LLGTGEQWGLNLAYAVQPSPDGLAQALIIGSEFVGNGPCALILGDNIFHGDQLADAVRRASELKNGATVFAYPVKDPERYGVVSFDKEGRAHTLEEKPQSPRSRYAVTGLYFYDHNAPDYARSLTPSNRGELEITDLNRVYLENGSLNVELLGRGTAWLDTGTHESLLQASVFIETLETRQGMKICCPEEIAFRMNYIGIEDLSALASKLGKSTYGTYLRQLVTEYQSGNS
jgi:glucose-1-phosphate thymidylyltransferase